MKKLSLKEKVFWLPNVFVFLSCIAGLEVLGRFKKFVAKL